MKIIPFHQLHPNPKVLLRFLLLLATLVAYFGYLSWKFDLATGGLIAALTWSFFVLCTPIADAGFLLDFPIRLILGVRMAHTEMLVWAIAISLNTWLFFWHGEVYQKTFLTSLLHKILSTPWPYWSIIILSCLGTFLSVIFGDEVINAAAHRHQDRPLHKKHHKKLKLITTIALALLVFWAYDHLLTALGVHLPKI